MGALFGFVLAPYERTTSFLKGAAAGPEAVLRDWRGLARRDGGPPAPRRVTRIPPAALDGPRSLIAAVRRATGGTIDAGLLPVLLGGEHTCTIGAAAACAACVEAMGVVQLDAHADLRDRYEGSRYSHACTMRRLRDDLRLPVLPVGIRAFSAVEACVLEESGTAYLPGRELRRHRLLLPPLLERLPADVYLTIDMDFFDPAVAPGVGTPEPGGAHWHEALEIIGTIARSRRVIGVDLVELCPPRERRVSVRAAVRILEEVLRAAGARAEKKRIDSHAS